MFASTIAERFYETCHDRGDARAVVWLPDRRAISFRELHEQYDVLLTALCRLRITPGDCVVSLLGNRPTFFPLLVACMEIGAVLLPLGETTDVEATTISQNAGAAAIVTDRALPLPIVEEIPVGSESIKRLAPAASKIDYGTSVVIKLTSGSTELPKATLTSERALLADCRSIVSTMDIRPEDINLGIIPLSHAYALGNVVAPLIAQGTAVALRPSFNPAQFVQDVVTSGASVFPGVPFMFDRLRDALEDHALPPSLRVLITAGARIEPATVQWFLEHQRRKIHSFYGASETGGITFDATDEMPDPLHVGRPLQGVTVELLPEPGVSAGGRVFVRGPGMANGYARAGIDEHNDAFQNGGFRSADVGYFNDKGQLVLTGRLSSLVNVAGRKVDPAEVERVLLDVPDVTDARVLGVDAPSRGQELVAFIVRSNQTLTPLTLRRRCADTLSPYKIPRRFIFLQTWPVDARGKVDRRALEGLAQTREADNAIT